MLIRRYLLAAAGQLLQAFLALATLAGLAHLLTASDFGTVVLLNSALAILTIALTAGLQGAAVVHSAATSHERGEVHGLSLLVAGLISVLSVIVVVTWSTPLARTLRPGLGPVVVVLAGLQLGPIVYGDLVLTALSGAGAIRAMVTVGVAAATTGLLAPVGAMLFGDHLLGAMAGALSGAAIWAIVVAVVGRRTLGLAPPSRRMVRRLALRLALPLHIGSVAYWLMLRSDLFVVNAMIGGPVVGVYGLSSALSDKVTILTSPAYSAAASRIAGSDEAESMNAMLAIARLEILIGVVLCAAAVVFGAPVIQMLGGPDYQGAYVPLAIMVLGSALLPVWASVGLFLVAHADGAWTTMWLQIGMAAAAFCGYLLVVPLAGIRGAAAVSTVAYALLTGTGIALAARRRPFPLRALMPGQEDVWALVRGARQFLRRAPISPES